MANELEKKPFYEKFIKKTENKKESALNGNKTKKISEKKEGFNKTKTETPEFIAKIKNEKKSIFTPLDDKTMNLLNSFGIIVKKALLLNSKQEALIPKDIRRLFHELTDERSSRKVNYLNNPVKLTAYIYHYMWWNLVRISKLISNMEFDLQDGNIIADFGSGPLTLACAFWIAKPELRKKRLHWYCADISGKALSAGESIFKSLCEFTEKDKDIPYAPWQITKVTGSFGTPLKTDMDFFVSANMFNEIFWDSSAKINGEAKKAVNTVLRYLNKKGAALIIEPGIPLAGEFISELRKNFLEKKFYVETPCPHNGICPIPGTKLYLPENKNMPIAFDKWCHFSFYTDEAPLNLVKTSETANLEKSRASLSFIYCKAPNKTIDKREESVYRQNLKDSDGFTARITSDIIKLRDGKIGRYACSEKGFLLLTEKNSFKAKLKTYQDGTLVKIHTEKTKQLPHDKKTGAAVINI
ncbi:small ribosomal subunit Rsm22 family protein [Treponema pedis]|uniref:small ribosomal subunit Rsm22 family protein n=1 Tax=Treponema pedis TaxID=409322 RepID=UPI00197F61E6|nr:small ribosomal subunit Rsm22 family protein [Treponema pedis]QSI03530.1 hypothetical protein DYQ05_00670 [Treponema pedis]